MLQRKRTAKNITRFNRKHHNKSRLGSALCPMKMLIQGKELSAVLQAASCNPDVVRGYRFPPSFSILVYSEQTIRVPSASVRGTSGRKSYAQPFHDEEAGEWRAFRTTRHEWRWHGRRDDSGRGVIATIFVDHRLRILRFTPDTERLRRRPGEELYGRPYRFFAWTISRENKHLNRNPSSRPYSSLENAVSPRDHCQRAFYQYNEICLSR